MNPSHAMDRNALAEIQRQLDALRPADADFLIVGVGTNAPNLDCPDGSAVATVAMGNDQATSRAAHLHDAIALARGKILRERKAKEEARKKAKGGAA